MPLSEYLNDSSDDEAPAGTTQTTMEITKCMGGILSSARAPPTPTDESLPGAIAGTVWRRLYGELRVVLIQMICR